MALSDLGNCFYDKAVAEGYSSFKVSRANIVNEVAVGNLIEMLLSISFACKDAMLDWEWLGIDPVEWPPQRLDWEIYRNEHLSFTKYMETTLDEWWSAPWHIEYAALRCMACLDWSAQHACPTCSNAGRNQKPRILGVTSPDAWTISQPVLSV